MEIRGVRARKIFNSRKEETIEVKVLSNKGTGVASAPSGASKGKFEVEVFPKNSVDEAIKNLNKINFKNIKIKDFNDFKKIEKYNLKGNTTIALEFAILKILSKGKPWKFLNKKAKKVPRPLGNCIGGGLHAGNIIDIQEFLLLPKTDSFAKAALINWKIYGQVRKELKKEDKTFNKQKTDEGAWAPNLENLEVLRILNKTIKKFTRKTGIKVRIGLDFAASQLWDGEKYVYRDQVLNKKEQLEFIFGLINDYNLVYVEDPFEETDFNSFKKLKKDVLICGDDLICTNLKRLKRAGNSINAVIIKPNQIGSLIETKKVVDFAKRKGIVPVISHRSGETLDNTISHLAVAWNIPLIKCGIYGKERQAKINELIKIERKIR